MDFMEKASSKKRLIDANALIKEANADGAYGYVDAKQIADAPTADVAPVRHGRWKYNTDFQVWNCSECGENPHKGTGVVVVEKNLPAYCPHCGVRMDGRRLEGKENETEELG